MSNILKISDILKTSLLFVILIAGFFVYSKYFSWTYLPISDPVICVYPLVNQNGTQIGIASHLSGDIRITAQHVLYDCGDNCRVQIKNYNNQTVDLNLGIRNAQDLGNDRGIFEIVSSWGFTPVNCATDNDGLVSYVSGVQQKIPVSVTGIFISYTPDYGQSGSPFFKQGKIIGVISKKWISGWILTLVDESSKN